MAHSLGPPPYPNITLPDRDRLYQYTASPPPTMPIHPLPIFRVEST